MHTLRNATRRNAPRRNATPTNERTTFIVAVGVVLGRLCLCLGVVVVVVVACRSFARSFVRSFVHSFLPSFVRACVRACLLSVCLSVKVFRRRLGCLATSVAGSTVVLGVGDDVGRCRFGPHSCCYDALSQMVRKIDDCGVGVGVEGACAARYAAG